MTDIISSDIELTAKEVLKELIQARLDDYPFMLQVTDLMKIFDASDTAIYERLRKGEIPGAKKYKGIGWRINRDILFTWIYAKGG